MFISYICKTVEFLSHQAEVNRYNTIDKIENFTCFVNWNVNKLFRKSEFGIYEFCKFQSR